MLLSRNLPTTLISQIGHYLPDSTDDMSAADLVARYGVKDQIIRTS